MATARSPKVVGDRSLVGERREYLSFLCSLSFFFLGVTALMDRGGWLLRRNENSRDRVNDRWGIFSFRRLSRLGTFPLIG